MVENIDRPEVRVIPPPPGDFKYATVPCCEGNWGQPVEHEVNHTLTTS